MFGRNDTVARASASVDRSLETSTTELIGLALLTAYYLLGDALFGENSYDTLNYYGPIGLIVTLVYGAFRMLKLNSSNIWASLFWFKVTSAVYFGFGQITIYLMDDKSRGYLEKYYRLSEQELFKLNLIVMLGIGCVLIAVKFASKIMRPLPLLANTQQQLAKLKHMKSLGMLLLIPGSLVKYLIVIPVAMGWTSGTVPGTIALIGSFNLASIYLLALWALSAKQHFAFIAIAALTVFEMSVGLALMTKTETLVPLLVFIIAILSHKVTLFRIATATAVLAFGFSVLVPVVSSARDQLRARGLDNSNLGIADRLEIVASYYDENTAFASNRETEGSLVRLSYTSPGAFFVNRFDSGAPGNSFRLLFASLIPRILWPDKPIIDLGRDMSVELTGRDNNAVGIGLFFESYWNFGWSGVVIVLLMFGVALTLLSRYASNVLRTGSFIYLPVVFLAMRVGLAVDNHVVAQVGGMAQVIGLHFAILIGNKLLGSKAGTGADGSRQETRAMHRANAPPARHV